MSVVTNIRAAAPALPDVVGYVEAFTADRIIGWAWAPAAPDLRATIELRLGAATVASSVAELHRPDLASNGIGDGRHAYELAIPPELRDRTAELRVFARAANGAAVPIGATPAADGLTDQVTKLLRGVDMLLNSQRMIHGNLAALTSKTTTPDPDPEAAAKLAGLADVQAATAQQLAAVEQFVVRLDEHLSKLAPASAKPAAATFPKAAMFALAVAAIALVVSTVGLMHSLGG